MESHSQEEGIQREAILINKDGTQGQVIEYVDYDGVAVFGGDILIHVDDRGFAAFQKEFLESTSSSSLEEKSAGRTAGNRLWTGNRVPYTVDPALNAERQQWVTQAIADYHAHTNLRFVPRTNEKNYLKFVNTDACSSYVGRVPSFTNGQDVNIGGCWEMGNVIHEIGHALGLFHEHTRADRDQHVVIHWSRIESGKSSQFEKYTEADGVDLGPYDFYSIMHYGCAAASNNGNRTIDPIPVGCNNVGQRDGLSAGDIAGLAELYPEVVTFDNSDAISDPNYQRGAFFVGNWGTGSWVSGYRFGNYATLNPGQAGGVVWSFDVPEAGHYVLYGHWPEYPTHSVAVPTEVEWSNGVIGGATQTAIVDQFTVDQSINGAQDNILGIYYLEAGHPGYEANLKVTMSATNDGAVVADTMALRKVEMHSATFDSIAAEDGWVLESGEFSDVGGNRLAATNDGAAAIRVGDDKGDRQYKSILSFNTASIGDGATILSAELQLALGSVLNANPFNSFGECRVDVHTGGLGGSTNLAPGDFAAVATVENAGTLSRSGYSALNSAGLDALNLTGTTQLRIYFELDDNDNRKRNTQGFYSGETAPPQLTVQWFE